MSVTMLYSTTRADGADPPDSSALSDGILQTHTNAQANKDHKKSRPERFSEVADKGRDEHDDLLRSWRNYYSWNPKLTY
jgi:hypothetical protein